MPTIELDDTGDLTLLLDLPDRLAGVVQSSSASGFTIISLIKNLPLRTGRKVHTFFAPLEKCRPGIRTDAYVYFTWQEPGEIPKGPRPIAVDVEPAEDGFDPEQWTAESEEKLNCGYLAWKKRVMTREAQLDKIVESKAQEKAASFTERVRQDEERLRKEREALDADVADWQREKAELQAILKTVREREKHLSQAEADVALRNRRIEAYEAIVPQEYVLVPEPDEESVPRRDTSRLACDFSGMLEAAGAGGDEQTAVSFLLSCLASAYLGSMVLLEGPVGVGKTKTATEAAWLLGGLSTVVPVRPAWLDSIDLLGFFDPVKETFRPTPFLSAFRRVSSGLHLLCLDELNLARIENYGADLLSRLEYARGLQAKVPSAGRPDAARLMLYSAAVCAELTAEVEYLAALPELDRAEYTRLRRTLAEHPASLQVPENLVLLGTLNMDATTHDLSPKVVDRSYVITFPPVQEFGHTESASDAVARCLITAGDVRNAVQARPGAGRRYLELLARWSRDYLTPFGIPLGHRVARDWQAFAAVADWTGLTEQAAWAHFTAVKLLPRIGFFRESEAQVTAFRQWLTKDLQVALGAAEPRGVVAWLEEQCRNGARHIRFWRDRT